MKSHICNSQELGTPCECGKGKISKLWESTEKLAEWLHEHYEAAAAVSGWKTQKKCQVDFEDLPKENKQVMTMVAEDLIYLIRQSNSEQPNMENWEQTLDMIFGIAIQHEITDNFYRDLKRFIKEIHNKSRQEGREEARREMIDYIKHNMCNEFTTADDLIKFLKHEKTG